MGLIGLIRLIGFMGLIGLIRLIGLIYPLFFTFPFSLFPSLEALGRIRCLPRGYISVCAK